MADSCATGRCAAVSNSSASPEEHSYELQGSLARRRATGSRRPLRPTRSCRPLGSARSPGRRSAHPPRTDHGRPRPRGWWSRKARDQVHGLPLRHGRRRARRDLSVAAAAGTAAARNDRVPHQLRHDQGHWLHHLRKSPAVHQTPRVSSGDTGGGRVGRQREALHVLIVVLPCSAIARVCPTTPPLNRMEGNREGTAGTLRTVLSPRAAAHGPARRMVRAPFRRAHRVASHRRRRSREVAPRATRVTRADGKVYIDDPNSVAGRRAVSIPPHLTPLVEAHLAANVGGCPSALLFPAQHGGNFGAQHAVQSLVSLGPVLVRPSRGH